MRKRLGERTIKERGRQTGKVEERVVRKSRNEKGASKKLGRGAGNAQEHFEEIRKRKKEIHQKISQSNTY